MQQAGVVIIGGGLAGAQVAIQLRQRKFAGPVTVLSEETHAPYWRPPLSKSILDGTEGPQSAALRGGEFWERRRIDLRLGEAALSLDTARKTVTTRKGETLAYAHAVLATGAHCIIPPLPGIDLPGVQVLRGLEDALALRDAVRPGARVAVLGGGFIGLEAASALTARGARVTVIEREPRLLARVAAPAMSDSVLALHRAHGVTVMLGRGATGIEDVGGAAARVRLEDGETIPFDRLLVCVGIRPETRLAAAAGLACEDGVLADQTLRSSDPSVFALGDCVRFPSRRYGGSLRLESIQNAIDGAAVVAAAICGETPCYDPLPMISSLQFGQPLDFIGLATGAGVSSHPRNAEAAEFVVLHVQNGKYAACECLNAMPDTVKKLREFIADEAPYDEGTFLRMCA
jgi:3-phenylpropionate/trans-cinnamate dioxygenase ferredoxin reductase subunit